MVVIVFQDVQAFYNYTDSGILEKIIDINRRLRKNDNTCNDRFRNTKYKRCSCFDYWCSNGSLIVTYSDFYYRFNVDAQTKIGRHVEEGTLEWWFRQS